MIKKMCDDSFCTSFSELDEHYKKLKDGEDVVPKRRYSKDFKKPLAQQKIQTSYKPLFSFVVTKTAIFLLFSTDN